jgi:hypothetical protein
MQPLGFEVWTVLTQVHPQRALIGRPLVSRYGWVTGKPCRPNLISSQAAASRATPRALERPCAFPRAWCWRDLGGSEHGIGPARHRRLGHHRRTIGLPLVALLTVAAAMRGWTNEKAERVALSFFKCALLIPIFCLALFGACGAIHGLGTFGLALAIFALASLMFWRSWRGEGPGKGNG